MITDRRRSGLILHPTSLPGRFGIGDLGSEAYRFVDFLYETHQGIWQVLPLGPTGYGDSPYQCFSAFAGNPLLIALERLVADGWLTASDLLGAPAFPADHVDYEAVTRFRMPLLARAHANFQARASAEQAAAFEKFRADNASWLDDFALFTALKDVHQGRPWHEWDDKLALRHAEALERARRELAQPIAACCFAQFQFFEQWAALRRYCHDHDVLTLGDVPIFVAHDSSDVWAHPELFSLAADGHPTHVAGVPPDYFSATGQRWGNPLYRWRRMRETGYAWWIERFRTTLSLVDLVRLDHFRGFEAYWEVPADEPTAVKGRWAKGPGATFFTAVESALGKLPIVAENLGVITPPVERLRRRFGFPGMAVLQFAFGSDPQGPGFRPHNYERNLVVYTGTHDNDTTVGWWTSIGAGDSTRSPEEIERERAYCRKYLDFSDDRDVHWAFIRAALASVADTAIMPVQDILGLGSEARMNVPARASGNWRFRLQNGQLTDAIRHRLAELTWVYGRTPPHPQPEAPA
jgi:4-alpha-glucanotransferase